MVNLQQKLIWMSPDDPLGGQRAGREILDVQRQKLIGTSVDGSGQNVVVVRSGRCRRRSVATITEISASGHSARSSAISACFGPVSQCRPRPFLQNARRPERGEHPCPGAFPKRPFAEPSDTAHKRRSEPSCQPEEQRLEVSRFRPVPGAADGPVRQTRCGSAAPRARRSPGSRRREISQDQRRENTNTPPDTRRRDQRRRPIRATR